MTIITSFQQTAVITAIIPVYAVLMVVANMMVGGRAAERAAANPGVAAALAAVVVGLVAALVIISYREEKAAYDKKRAFEAAQKRFNTAEAQYWADVTAADQLIKAETDVIESIWNEAKVIADMIYEMEDTMKVSNMRKLYPIAKSQANWDVLRKAANTAYWANVCPDYAVKGEIYWHAVDQNKVASIVADNKAAKEAAAKELLTLKAELVAAEKQFKKFEAARNIELFCF